MTIGNNRQASIRRYHSFRTAKSSNQKLDGGQLGVLVIAGDKSA
jgi:hypothetical protein